MRIIEAALLGIVQGVAEFLPVSSSGHLVVLQDLLDPAGLFGDSAITFDLALHVGTLVPILLVFRTDLLELGRKLASDGRAAVRFLILVFLGSLPAGIVGVAFEDALEEAFSSPLLVGLAFLLTGGYLLLSKRSRGGKIGLDAITPSAAFLIGIAQAAAVTPGISRSGSTIVTALLLGVAGRDAAFFSFILGFIAISGAAVLHIPDALSGGIDPVATSIGMITALAAGTLSLGLLVRMTQRGSIHRFAPYLFVVGILSIILGVAGA